MLSMLKVLGSIHITSILKRKKNFSKKKKKVEAGDQCSETITIIHARVIGNMDYSGDSGGYEK